MYYLVSRGIFLGPTGGRLPADAFAPEIIGLDFRGCVFCEFVRLTDALIVNRLAERLSSRHKSLGTTAQESQDGGQTCGLCELHG